MNIGIIKDAMLEVNKSSCKFNEEERTFIAYYAYKMGDLTQVKFLIAELEHADEPGEKDFVFQRHSKLLNIQSGIEHQVEVMMVSIERYRIGQEQAIIQLSEILKANGIDVSCDEIRTSDISEVKNKISQGTRR